MVKITNISPTAIVFRETTKNGEAGKVVEIEPGATETVDIPADHVDVVARVNARLIAVNATKATRDSAAAAAPEPVKPDKPAA